MNAAFDGVDALRDAGFEAEIDHDMLIDGPEAFGAVWLDLSKDPTDADIIELLHRVAALLGPCGGDCFEFGVGSETAVWRD
jgi:hypothetical protein